MPFVANTAHDEDIARLHAEGKGRNQIARELEIAPYTVSSASKRMGLVYDGSQRLMAAETLRREAAERRSELTIGLLDDVERLRARLFGPITYTQYGGKDFEKREDTLSEPLPQDQASLARAVGMLLDRAIKLDEYDRTGATLDDAFNFLDGVNIVIRGEVVPNKSIEGSSADND